MLRAAIALFLFMQVHDIDATVLFASPSSVYATATPGGFIEADLRVTCGCEHAVAVSVGTSPFVLDARGRPMHVADADRALDEWLRIDQSAPSVDAAHPLTIHLRADMPSNANGTYWTAVMVEWKTRGPAAGGSALVASLRLAIPVLVTAGGTERPRAEIEELTASAGTDAIDVAAAVHNSGNTALRVPLFVAIETDDGGAVPLELGAGATDSILVFPGTSRIITLRMARPRADLRGATVAAFYRFGDAPGDVAILNGALINHGEPPKRVKPM